MYRKLSTLAKALDFTNEREAANYLFESWINGNYTQVREMFQSLHTEEKSKCLSFLREFNEAEEVSNFAISALGN